MTRIIPGLMCRALSDRSLVIRNLPKFAINLQVARVQGGFLRLLKEDPPQTHYQPMQISSIGNRSGVHQMPERGTCHQPTTREVDKTSDIGAPPKRQAFVGSRRGLSGLVVEFGLQVAPLEGSLIKCILKTGAKRPHNGI